MPDIDVLDSTWIGVAPAVVAAAIAEPGSWRSWWPDLDVVASEWRGEQGIRWLVRSCRNSLAGLAGTMEVWLEPVLDGVVVHYFLRLDRADGRPLRPRRRARHVDAARRRAKQVFWALGDRLDPARAARVAGPR